MKTIDKTISKEIELFKKDISSTAKKVELIEVKDEISYKKAIDQGRLVQEILKKITERKEEITKPLNQALKSTRELFKPLETFAEETIKEIKLKMISYQQEITKKAEAEKAKILARVEKGTMTPETAVRKLNEDIVTPEKTIEAENGSASLVKRKAYRVTNKKKIPLEFLEVDMIKVKASFKAGKPVEGIEEYEVDEMRFGS